ncbi:hypothetical protein Aple_037370 [Acrocarpospora pleiomorpha]|uniref:Uncharacterized protein n=1 Tax=Acrocarpospora pleiomorpha TaxID=90975 RepID=A0A5M3XMG8_9ACTN|nr:hypothetical protein Aple_037370 [Acrocarpospora pleiomorpha]
MANIPARNGFTTIFPLRSWAPQIYAGRNVVERCFNRLKQFRDLATRYAERAAYFRAEITLSAAILWFRLDLQDTPWSRNSERHWERWRETRMTPGQRG